MIEGAVRHPAVAPKVDRRAGGTVARVEEVALFVRGSRAAHPVEGRGVASNLGARPWIEPADGPFAGIGDPDRRLELGVRVQGEISLVVHDHAARVVVRRIPAPPAAADPRGRTALVDRHVIVVTVRSELAPGSEAVAVPIDTTAAVAVGVGVAIGISISVTVRIRVSIAITTVSFPFVVGTSERSHDERCAESQEREPEHTRPRPVSTILFESHGTNHIRRAQRSLFLTRDHSAARTRPPRAGTVTATVPSPPTVTV